MVSNENADDDILTWTIYLNKHRKFIMMKMFNVHFADLSRLIGIAPFDFTLYDDGGSHEWRMWLRSFEWYLQANEIEDAHQKFVKLMHLAGQKIQDLYATLPIPEHVNNAPRGPLMEGYIPYLDEYEMAIAKLNDHFEPKKNTTYERHELRQLKQEDEEKIAIFAMRLRKQAERCDFGENFEDHVKDQLIEKCSSPKLRRKLLALGDANLDTVLREAKAFEAVHEQGKALDDKKIDSNKLSEVNRIDTRPKSGPNYMKSTVCHRCGYTGHRQFDENCPAKGKKCNKCDGLNHFAKQCRSKKRPRNVIEKTDRGKSESESKNMVKKEDEPSPKRKAEEVVKFVNTEEDKQYIFCIENTDLRHFTHLEYEK